jgi:hypothetical protein
MHGFYDFGDLRIGMRVNVEGEHDGNGSLRARTISIKDDGDADEIEANVQSADPGSRTIRLLGLALSIGSEVEIKGLDKQPMPFESLASGTRIKTKGMLQEGRRFRPDKIKVKSRTPDEMDEVEGAITALDPHARTITVLGFRIACGEDCEIEA